MIQVSSFKLGEKEKAYVNDAMSQNELTWHGKYIDLFEDHFADYLGVNYASTCSSGTSALHLALVAAGIKPLQQVIVPALTYVATANAVAYCQAEPIICDVSPLTWNLDIDHVETLIRRNSRIAAIIAVHLYGVPCDLDSLKNLCSHYNIVLIEDAAQALGAKYKDEMVGGIGDIGAFSLYANKIITTGEGGMVVTKNRELAKKVWYYRGQCQDRPGEYFHSEIGFNYRMTNLQAAVGYGQLEQIDTFIKERKRIGDLYRKLFFGRLSVQGVLPDTKPVDWMFTVLMPFSVDRAIVAAKLKELSIETRPVFIPLNQLPMYSSPDVRCPIANSISKRGLNLPTHPGLSDKDVAYIAEHVLKAAEVAA